MNNKRGVSGAEVVAVLAVIGLLIAWFKPSAAKSNADDVEKRTNQVAAANLDIDEKVAASINQIGVANGLAPDSTAKDFIGREVTLITPLLPSPSPEELLAAEKRRLAVMEGRLEEANKLYNTSQKQNKELLAELVSVNKDLDELKNELFEKAGAAEFMKKVSIVLSILVTVGFGLWIYSRFVLGKYQSGLREFLTYNKNDKVLAEVREAFDSSVKKIHGL